jgi:hypothetical protein
MRFGGGHFRGGDRIKRGSMLPGGAGWGLLDGCLPYTIDMTDSLRTS